MAFMGYWLSLTFHIFDVIIGKSVRKITHIATFQKRTRANSTVTLNRFFFFLMQNSLNSTAH